MNSGDDIIGVCEGGALSRLTCATCGPESLHQRGKCVHCGRKYVPADTMMVRKKGQREEWVINPRKADQRRLRARASVAED